MTVTEQFIFLQAPNAAAVENGRKLSKTNRFSVLRKSSDETLYWADCAGSGKNPYHTSIDWTNPETPVCRCSCPSRQHPCKHALGLMFEMLTQKQFETAEIPQDILDKRAKQEARAAKKQTAGKSSAAKPKKSNSAAQAKKLKRQLEGLDMAEKMTDNLLTAGLGTLAGASAQTYDKLAKDLGSYYLTGPQMSFSRIALLVRNIQKNPEQAGTGYVEALRVLISLHSTIKKARVFLQNKLEAGQYSAEDTVLFEALGGVWRLEDLHAIGAYQENARLVQLSFDVLFDEAKKEYIERGYWMNLNDGRIDCTRNLRPVKALKFIKADDSRFELLEIPFLYTYPGEGSRRIRWENAVPRLLTAEEQAMIPTLCQSNLAEAVKLVKGQIKNTLLPNYAPVLLPFARIGQINQQFVLEDATGSRILLRDRPEDGDSHACTGRLASLPQENLQENRNGSALFGLMFYDDHDRRICLHPYSLVTPAQIIRLLY